MMRKSSELVPTGQGKEAIAPKEHTSRTTACVSRKHVLMSQGGPFKVRACVRVVFVLAGQRCSTGKRPEAPSSTVKTELQRGVSYGKKGVERANTRYRTVSCSCQCLSLGWLGDLHDAVVFSCIKPLPPKTRHEERREGTAVLGRCVIATRKTEGPCRQSAHPSVRRWAGAIIFGPGRWPCWMG
jgi:hypothetical protein